MLNTMNVLFVYRCLTCNVELQITDRRFGRTHLAIYGPKWAKKKRKSEKLLGKIAVRLS